MKKYLGIPIVLGWLLALPAWSMERPDTLVDNTAQEVLTMIRQDKELRSGNHAKLLNLIEVKILPHFDFTRMTRLAMERTGLKLPPSSSKHW